MANMIPISTVTVGSGGASSIEFTNIPQNYTDLLLKISLRGNRSALFDQQYLTINGNTGATMRYLLGDGAFASSGTGGNQIGLGDGTTATASTFGNTEVYIPNYAGSNNKSFSTDSVTENNGTNAYASLFASLWSNTSAITSLNITTNSGTILQYSSATLYGIRKY